MTRFVYVLPAGRFRWEVRVDADDLIEATAEILYQYEEWSVDSNGVPYDSNHPWDTIGGPGQDRYRAEARAVIRVAMPGNAHNQHYRRKAHALIAARAIALVIGGEVQPHDRRGRIQDPSSFGGDSPRRKG